MTTATPKDSPNPSSNVIDRWSVLLGPLFLMVFTAFQLPYYGTRWELGRFGMPRTLLAEDGMHHADGTEIDPVSLAIIRSGHEETFLLVELLWIAGMGLGTVLIQRRTAHARARIAAMREYLASLEPPQ